MFGIGRRLRRKREKKQNQGYYALNELDKKIEPYLDFDNGFFVELGANDGVSQSNTLRLEQKRGWRGVLIEPSPPNYLKCISNRAPENAIFCNACVDFDYDERFVEMIYADLMSVGKNLELDLPDVDQHLVNAQQHFRNNEREFAYGAIARPLNDLLDEANAPKRIDLLSLDVEGAELIVLRGIDHTKYRFRFMLIECRDLDRMTAYLNAQDYVLEKALTHHDYLFRDTKVRP